MCFMSVYYRNHDWISRNTLSFHFISFPACLLDINCANIGYEGKHVTFHISYPEGYETNTKYFGKKDGFFFEKLVQTSHPYRWAKQGRFALFDNTSARILTATILQLVVDDSGLYSFGVDVKLSPDLSSDIQLTVRRGENPFTGLIGYESVFSHTWPNAVVNVTEGMSLDSFMFLLCTGEAQRPTISLPRGTRVK